MSKSLKKLIDINRLREFKNKLVGTGSAYVQTGAVDQTVAGTKTFSKPIVGSVTGNAATATTATTAKACTGNAATATKLAAKRTINGTAFDGTANVTTASWGTARNITITDGTNTSTAVRVNGSANVALTLPATIKANLTGNSDTATKATQDSAGQQIDTTYIKGLAVSGRTITYTKGDNTTGTITTQDTNTDTKVTQTVTTTNTEYPVLFSADANKTATSTTTVRFSSNIKINPSTNTITATTFKGNLTGNVTGNASTAATAATATNATYANWLRTSSHSDHLFHTEWDKAGYFWTYVTTGNGDYRAVRVARSDSAATAQSCTGNAATATKLATARSLWGNNFDGSAAITGSITGTPSIEFMPATTANHGGFLDFHYNQSTADHTSRIIESASGTLSINNVTITTGKVVTATTFNGALIGNVTGNCSGSSGSCTGNAATATKAVSADSATNASHATSADKATKAEQDGNGNNIVASYVAAGSEGSTTDIGAFMAARPSFIKSFTYNNVWTDAISMRHRNGGGDGSNYGTYIRSSAMTGVSNLLWNHQYAGNWQGERTLVDSANLAGFTKSAVTVYDLVPDGAAVHNCFYRGKDLTAAFNNGTVSANIKNGTFRDIFPGDYITKKVTIYHTTYTVNWVVADCDYWINKGDTPTTDHHVVIVPQVPIFDGHMNPTNKTEGGYAGSNMYREVIHVCANGIVDAFGSDHILTFRDHLSREVSTSAVPSGITASFVGAPTWEGSWVSAQCNLMSEKMVYGAPICSGGAIDNVMATRQMSAFRLSEKLINYKRASWWLRDVVASALFADVLHAGNAHASYASDVHGVRPFALLR